MLGLADALRIRPLDVLQMTEYERQAWTAFLIRRAERQAGDSAQTWRGIPRTPMVRTGA